jgi:hypothetical protein
MSQKRAAPSDDDDTLTAKGFQETQARPGAGLSGDRAR